MVVNKILHHQKFVVEFRALTPAIQARAVKAERFFRSNPLHPSLRLHPLKGPLKGSWSLSVTMNVRIIFKRLANGTIVFYSIGRHDIYRNL